MWDEISRWYRAGVTPGVIAKAFNLSRTWIKRQAAQYGWARDRADFSDAVPLGEPSGSPWETEPAVVAAVHEPRDLLMERHRSAWANVNSLRGEAYRIPRGEEPEILKGVVIDSLTGRISVAKKLFLLAGKEARALAAVQESQRRVYGLDYKRLQEAQRQDDAEAHERQELIKSLLTSFESMKQRANGANNDEGALRQAGPS
jgi:hypothetical protein